MADLNYSIGEMYEKMTVTKPLLILDLNGILIDRVRFSKNRKKDPTYDFKMKKNHVWVRKNINFFLNICSSDIL